MRARARERERERERETMTERDHAREVCVMCVCVCKVRQLINSTVCGCVGAGVCGWTGLYEQPLARRGCGRNFKWQIGGEW